MVWALKKIVIHGDEGDSSESTFETQISVTEISENVRAVPFSDAELRGFDEAYNWLDSS